MDEMLSPQDYEHLGRDFSDSKVMMARRIVGDNYKGFDHEIKAVAAYRELPEAFYVHSFWAEGQLQDSFDAEAISLLVFQLRRTATSLGYPGVSFQLLLPEFTATFVYLQMHFCAKPEAIMGFIPGIRERWTPTQ